MSYNPYEFTNPKLYHPKREEFLQQLSENENFKNIYKNFNRIGEKMIELCGHPNFDNYTTHLIKDNRDGQRQGFPEDIGIAIIKINRLHDQWMAS
jgi:hypothetical protein